MTAAVGNQSINLSCTFSRKNKHSNARAFKYHMLLAFVSGTTALS